MPAGGADTPTFGVDVGGAEVLSGVCAGCVVTVLRACKGDGGCVAERAEGKTRNWRVAWGLRRRRFAWAGERMTLRMSMADM